jgi:hypothetical protein
MLGRWQAIYPKGPSVTTLHSRPQSVTERLLLGPNVTGSRAPRKLVTSGPRGGDALRSQASKRAL